MSLIIAMFMFSLVMSVSPGPVNMIILSSAANYGIKQTALFVSGATVGFTILLAFIGFGFIHTINLHPIFLKILALFGSLYIMYMGYKTIFSKPNSDDFSVKKNACPKFHEGFLLQWLNPKAWITCVSGVSLFSSVQHSQQLPVFVIIYFFTCYASQFLWMLLGDRVTILLNNQARLRSFNVFMGSMLIVIAAYLLWLQFFDF